MRCHGMIVRKTRLFLTRIVSRGRPRVDILEEKGIKLGLGLLGAFGGGAFTDTFGLGFEKSDKATPPLIRWEIKEQLLIATNYDHQSITVEIECP